VKRFVRENGAALALAVVAAAGLKLAYSRLGPDQLTFMTGPTQALVTLITGCDFTYESDYGYVSLAHRIVIAKSCTGVNYLLAVFGMLAFTLVPAAAGQRAKLLALGSVAGISYATTVAVNSLRIALGIALRDAGFAWGWLTPERVHRAAGIVVYFLALVAVHALASRTLLRPCEGGRRCTGMLRAPLVWYGLVALALPFLNGAFLAHPRLFAEHSAWVLAVALLLAGGLGLLSRRRAAASSYQPTPTRDAAPAL